jgi:hypothetical protein
MKLDQAISTAFCKRDHVAETKHLYTVIKCCHWCMPITLASRPIFSRPLRWIKKNTKNKASYLQMIEYIYYQARLCVIANACIQKCYSSIFSKKKLERYYWMLWKRNTRPAAQLVGWCVCEMCLSVSDKHLKSRRLTTGSAVATAESVVRYELWTVTQIGRHTQFPCSWKRVEIEKRLSNTWTEQQGHNDHHVSRHSSEPYSFVYV